jgi:23S rRNA pseudouridine1911/1915/1917 synthase
MTANDSTQRFRVPETLDGSRLDRALASVVEGFSRERLREMVEDGRVQVDGVAVQKPSRAVFTGELVEVELVLRDRSRPGSALEARLAILHEDEHVLAVDKPAGMVVHPSSVVRGGTVSELCVERFGPLPCFQGDDRPGIVHRLDKDTSGVMLVARTDVAGAELLRQFREREVEKTYLALVTGVPRFDSDWISAPIERVTGEDRMAIAAPGEGRGAETFYEVRERFDGFALLACRPSTGRTHQIRVHLAAAEHSVVGDPLYRSRRAASHRIPEGAPRLSRQALHAHSLVLRHPVSGSPLELVAPLAPDIAALVDFLREDRARKARQA